MGTQHDIGEHTNELAVALDRFDRFELRGGRDGLGWCLEQKDKPLYHAVETQCGEPFGAAASTEDLGSQCLVGGSRRLR